MVWAESVNGNGITTTAQVSQVAEVLVVFFGIPLGFSVFSTPACHAVSKGRILRMKKPEAVLW